MSEPVSQPSLACTCPYCRLRGLTMPILLIAIGVLFLLHMTIPAMTGSVTFAILLIVVGGVQLVQRLVPMSGHRNIYLP